MMKRTPPERAIIFAGVLGGLALDEINTLLREAMPKANPLLESSYQMMRKSYFGKMVDGIGSEASSALNEFGQMIFHPKPIGDL